jgi:hypothetical protein
MGDMLGFLSGCHFAKYREKRRQVSSEKCGNINEPERQRHEKTSNPSLGYLRSLISFPFRGFTL